MKYYAILSAVIILILIAGANINTGIAKADQGQQATAYQQADLKTGAQLYDNWLKITGTKPEGNHPLYPSDAKKSGTSTWRCKECHGWDYIGSKGRYRNGSHFTGITGVYNVRAEKAESLFNGLTRKETQHDFSEYLSRSQVWSLVKFLREGQAAIEPVIDGKGQAKGSAIQGKALYDAQCSSCHGADGNSIDFKSSKEGVQGVGWLAKDNPQESIHKIRWGHPGSKMPSMLADKGLSEQDAIDILTYCQSLYSMEQR